MTAPKKQTQRATAIDAVWAVAKTFMDALPAGADELIAKRIPWKPGSDAAVRGCVVARGGKCTATRRRRVVAF